MKLSADPQSYCKHISMKVYTGVFCTFLRMAFTFKMELCEDFLVDVIAVDCYHSECMSLVWFCIHPHAVHIRMYSYNTTISAVP